ncbi:TAXI family TRAP transporter solute-binding subunit [Tropicimonas sp.]|uniref:TAXI family TRAP transporter solute-binding subunit n=1 Tax=Tropicimonas sp. TaxID=2067044 RepID=UPI003A8C1F08
MNFIEKLVSIAAVACAVSVSSGAAGAQGVEFEKNILTGGPTGTYIQIGRDIAGLAGKCGMTLNVLESGGGMENFLAVRKTPHTQFGIVQNDVLEYLRTYAADDPAIARAIFGVRIAFPLYNEELHILAKKEIASIEDLAGRRVAIGDPDSGTFLTSSLVLDLSGIEPAERLGQSADASLAQLLAGEIDAFFYVAGVPTKIFMNDAIDAERFHLLPITSPTLRAAYVETSIPAGTYSFQPEAVEVIAVKAVLMTYEYNRNKNAYNRASCDAVSDISNLIFTRFGQLRESGHPKWKNVDLNDIPPGWDVSACVNRGLAEDYQPECAPKVPPPAAGSEANRVYRARICATFGC